ncbi:DUF4440 domain-containing protein [Bacillus sp. M6-12]|uniref:nuclear transport factor 2 family protein n=1 Tax=Bacillus sp. M6-12 TaxID=2054166 RepID=UPI000C75F19F|nr:DUF4440 domain-containing protein [Bacillus sp. M6-12]PLS18649.1 DUF4440 domain-containing protein [Bacillus sp. M6-12]
MAMESSLKEHLRELEELLLKSEIRTSPEKLKQILAESFFEFGSSGKVLYKDEGIGKEGLSVAKMTMSDFEIHPLSEEIVLTTYRIYNHIKEQHSLRSSIWKFNGGRWQMFFHQGTNTSL